MSTCRLILICTWVELLLQSMWLPALLAQPPHAPLTMPRQRVVQSCGAALLTSHPSTPYTLSTICGLSSIGTIRSGRTSIMLGFWLPINVITSFDDDSNILAGEGIWAWPNPFRDVLNLDLTIPMFEYGYADIYNSSGSQVASLSPQQIRSNGALFTWSGLDMHSNPVSNGVYTVRITVKQLLAQQRSVISTSIVCNR